jgi:serpin B
MWQTPFSKTETKPQEFHCIDGKKVQVPMMRQKAGFRYTSQKDYACIELPYATAGFSMFVILPNEQVDFKPFVQQIDEQNFSAMINSLQKIEVSLQLPKFKMESDYGLVPMLQKCGVKQPFENIADFSLINKAKDIHIDDIRQKAVIEVDEEGTEAAAATAVTMSRAVLQPPPVVFIAERPFVYVLFDSVRNEIMFIGTKVK